jgi:hypothetical protein
VPCIDAQGPVTLRRRSGHAGVSPFHVVTGRMIIAYSSVAKLDNVLAVDGGLESDTNNVLRYGAYTFVSCGMPCLFTVGHKTWLIPLDRSWTTEDLNATAIDTAASGLINQALSADETERWLYAMNGELSANGRIDRSDPQSNSFYKDREPEIWAMNMAPDFAGQS